MNPKISIVTINYNNSIGLEKTIQSVLIQNYQDIEYLVIDGGSIDESVDVINKYSSSIHFWVSEKDSGVYNAQNKGIQNSTGDYVLFLNSGDYFLDENSISVLAKNNEDILFGDIVYVSETNEKTEPTPDFLDLLFFFRSTIPHPCSLIKRSLFLTYGLYKEDIKICADWAFFMDMIIKNKVTYKHVSRPISAFVLGGISSKPESYSLIEDEKEQYINLNYNLFFNLYVDNRRMKNKLRVIETNRILARGSRILNLLIRFFPLKQKTILKALIN